VTPSNSSRRNAVVVASLLVIILLALFLRSEPTPEPLVRAPLPAFVPAPPPRPPRAASEMMEHEEPAHSPLHVRLRGRWRSSHHATFDPSLVADLLKSCSGFDEALLEGHERWQMLTAAPGEFTYRAQVEAFGEPTELDSPEAALLALYSEWMRSEAQYRLDWRAFELRHLGDGVRLSDLSSAERAALRREPDSFRKDVSGLARLAEEVLASWPEHPVADHALLTALRSEMAFGADSEAWDTARMAEWMMAIEDPLIAEYGAEVLTQLPPRMDVDVVLLDAMADVDVASPTRSVRVASWAMNRALNARDENRVGAWAARLRNVLSTVCEGNGVVDSVECDRGAYELRDVAGRLAAMGHSQPMNWQEAITAESWRCHLVDPHRGTSEATATWTGESWSFGVWDRSTPVTRCLSAAAIRQKGPAVGFSVRVRLEGPAEKPGGM